MSRFTVVIADDRYASYREEEEVLREVDAEIRVFRSGAPAEAKKTFASADGILVNLYPMTAEMIDSLKGCRVISRYGVGYDNVDVEAATRKGIWVTFVPDYCFEEVADHALALLLCCIRKIGYKDRMVRQGRWNTHRDQPCYRVEGKTLGILGYGNAAHTLLRKVSGLGFGRVLMCDPYVRASTIKAAGAVPVDLPVLMAESDYISVHVTLTPETRHMIGREQLALVKPGAILVNTARGPVLDENALAEALASGRLGGAGLDVFEKEPLPAESPLRNLDTVVFTDHAGWYSEESMGELKTKAARNVAAVLAGGPPLYPVNRL
ncbi:MAG TPA: C-terminal binding protein [Spirochaetia bacterium]|nr:C-terminal binding protein [Spirochaetia bacterium]